MSSLVEINNLSVSYPVLGGILGRRIGEIQAVNSVSFTIQKQEVVGLVGESGCGKSTLGKALLRLIEPNSGTIHFDGTSVCSIDRSSLRKLRKRMQMIFQDPFSSLNPRMKVGSILSEPFVIHKLCAPNQIKTRVGELLEIVGLRPESYEKYPHEFSGGQRQRIGIARALAVKPDFIVADEPVSALDVSIQSQILNLLKKLQTDFHLTYLFVSHDLNVIRYLCDRVVVMYLGKIMEVLNRDQLIDPHYKKHPYTEALIASAPRSHPDEIRTRKPLQGDIPSPQCPPSGCVFHTRCPEVQELCKKTVPVLKPSKGPSGLVACHYRGIDSLSSPNPWSDVPTDKDIGRRPSD